MAAAFTAETTYTFRGATFKTCYLLISGVDFQLFWRHCSPGHESGAMWTPAHTAMAMPAKQGRKFYCELHSSTKAASRYQFICHSLLPRNLCRLSDTFPNVHDYHRWYLSGCFLLADTQFFKRLDCFRHWALVIGLTTYRPLLVKLVTKYLKYGTHNTVYQITEYNIQY